MNRSRTQITYVKLTYSCSANYLNKNPKTLNESE